MQYLKQFIKNYADVNFCDNFMRLNNTVQNLFTYENAPKTLNTMMLENYLHLTPFGMCAAINDKEYGIISVRGNYGGDVDVNGIGTHFIGASTKKSYDIDINDDNIVICHNNVTWSSDYWLIEKYATILNEIDKSLNTNVIYSRVYPVPRVKNQKEEKQIISILKAIIKGEIGRVMSAETDVNTLLQKDNVDMVNLTDGNQSVHMDTLIRLKDNVFKNFLREIGINVNTMDKSAQVNNNELQAFVTYANLNLIDYYNERKKFVKEINEKFGTDIKIKYNETFIKQLTETETVPDVTETDKNLSKESDGENNASEKMD